MHHIHIYTLENQDAFMVNPDCDACSSGGTCQGCEPTLRKVSDTVKTFNKYYHPYASCIHNAVKAGDSIFGEVLEQGPVTTIDDQVYSTGRLPGAYELKEYLLTLNK